MQNEHPDLWGVWRDRQGFRAKARQEPFSQWTEAFLDEQTKRLENKRPAASADAALDARQVAQQAEAAAFAYVLTADDQFAQRAHEDLRAIVAGGGSWVSPSHVDMYPDAQADLYTAEITKAIATTLSWIAPTLEADTMSSLVHVLAERGARPIYEDACAGAWWGNALNSNWTAVLNGGLIFGALMLREYDSATAEEWLSYGRARLIEMLDLAAEEGAGVEGAGYWLYCFGSIQDAAEALTNAAEDDILSHPFWRGCSGFLPYLALPDFTAWVNYADTAYRGIGGSSFFHGVAARQQDGLAQWFGDRILAQHGGLSWKNVVYYDPAVPAEPIDEEPACRFFSSIHLASFRSSWDDDAAFLLFKGGSNAWSHTHLDLNSFFIAAHGERLAVDPGPAPYSVHYWHSIEPPVSTAWHNCIVVDGGHQRVAAQYAMSYDLEEAGDCYSRLDGFLDSAEIAMIRGDASTAYGDTLERAWRDIVFLKPGVFIVFDDLVPHQVRCHRNFEWMLHSEYPLQEVPGGFEVGGERATLSIQPVLPHGWEAKTVEGRSVSKGADVPLHALSLRPYWHHKWNVDSTRRPFPDWDSRGDKTPLYPPTCRYLVVLTPLPNGEKVSHDLEAIDIDTASGVRLRSDVETATVLFNPDGNRLEVGDIRTDAERLVIRQRPDHVSWAAVRGTTVEVAGRSLFEESERVSRTGQD